jgi:8-oxo-dGTP pyrophosphatase MutT (NUDIX family)
VAATKQKSKKSKKSKKKTLAKALSALTVTTTSSSSSSVKKRAAKPPAKGLPAVLSCGVLLHQKRPVDAVLALLRHDGSPDLPKGHMKAGESDLDAALREFEEETGIDRARIVVDVGRSFESTYRTRAKKTGRLVNKTVRIFKAEIDGPVVVDVEAHRDYAWLRTGDRPALEAALVENPTFLGAVRALLHRESV